MTAVELLSGSVFNSYSTPNSEALWRSFVKVKFAHQKLNAISVRIPLSQKGYAP